MLMLKAFLLTIIVIIFLVEVVFRIIAKLFPFPAPSLTGIFLDSGFRRIIQPPAKVIKRSGIKEGMRVLEVGCGSGAFVDRVARAIGQNGRLYALDINPGMLRQTERKLARPENIDIRNVELVRSNARDLPFADETFDLVYMVTVLHEIPDRMKAVKEVNRILKPGGIFSVTELLIDPHYPLRSTVIRVCSKADFITLETFGNFFNYTIRFKKSG